MSEFIQSLPGCEEHGKVFKDEVSAHYSAVYYLMRSEPWGVEEGPGAELAPLGQGVGCVKVEELMHSCLIHSINQLWKTSGEKVRAREIFVSSIFWSLDSLWKPQQNLNSMHLDHS